MRRNLEDVAIYKDQDAATAAILLPKIEKVASMAYLRRVFGKTV